MGATDAFAGLTFEEVGVVFAPDEAAGVLVDGVYIAQVGHGQQAGHVGVVHEQLVAETVDFEGVDLTIFRVVVHGIFLQGGLYLLSQVGALPGQRFVVVDGAQNLGRLPQRGDGEEVGGDEELEGGGVVRRTEGRADEAHGFHGVAQTHVGHRVESPLGAAHEFIGAHASFALLLLEGAQDVGDGVDPLVAEDRGIARHLPVVVGEADGVA